ncbi:hypothetical protein PRVXH_000271 [Proteinivorax hydrogeniformans]|uniref:Methyl-accepting chemotaxis protein n=1 Tax=Proteinivorax hydrogeniformans TaxID=1826727 RepID=A0AAU8HUD1_9FIRM
MKLRGKILATILTAVILVFLVITGINLVSSRTVAQQQATEVAEAVAENYASEIQETLNTAKNTAKNLSINITTMLNNDMG